MLAGFLLVRGWSRKAGATLRNSAHAAAREKGATADTTSAPAASPSPQNPITKSTAVFARVAALGSNTVVVAVPTNRAPSVLVATNFPALKVQGIFYRARNPSAMINSKSVFVGDHVSGVTIVGITADSVTVEMNGTKKVLTLY